MEQQIRIRGSRSPHLAYRGTPQQLAFAAAGELRVDVAIASMVSYELLSTMHRGVQARRYAVMGHDYHVPFGPWGGSHSNPRFDIVRQLLASCTVLCTSAHLASYLQRWSCGLLDCRVCYCADYGYFASSSLPDLCEDG
eukprot:5610475-Amphidinium_carterae.1